LGTTERATPSTTPDRSPAPTSPKTFALTPLKAFALVLALAAIAATTIYLTRPTPTSTDASGNTPSVAADESVSREAIATTAKSLQTLVFRAYEERDVGLLRQAAEPESDFFEVASQEIAQLLRRDLQIDYRFEFLSFETTDVEGESALVVARVISGGETTDNAGRRVGKPLPRRLQTVEYTLSQTEAGWRIRRALVTSSERAPDK
jgi:hypothetical protein